jgi:hypothetical protein
MPWGLPHGLGPLECGFPAPPRGVEEAPQGWGRPWGGPPQLGTAPDAKAGCSKPVSCMAAVRQGSQWIPHCSPPFPHTASCKPPVWVPRAWALQPWAPRHEPRLHQGKAPKPRPQAQGGSQGLGWAWLQCWALPHSSPHTPKPRGAGRV